MKKRTKSLLAAFCTMALCGCLIAGSTYALFTDTASVNIAVTSGKVDVEASVQEKSLKTYSVKSKSVLDEKDQIEANLVQLKDVDFAGDYYYVQTNKDSEDNSGSFVNGGTAELKTDNNQEVLELLYITPGDKVEFDIDITNESNVNVWYRVNFSSTEKTADSNILMSGLNFTIAENGSNEEVTATASDDSDTDTTETTTQQSAGLNLDYSGYTTYITKWLSWTTAEAKSKTVHAVVSLPISAGNVYQGKSIAIALKVEAVQKNANIGDNTPTKLSSPKTVTTDTDSAVSASVSLPSGTKVTGDNVTLSVNEVTFNEDDEEKKVGGVDLSGILTTISDNNNSSITYNISLSGISGDNTEYVSVVLTGIESDVQSVYHSGNAMTKLTDEVTLPANSTAEGANAAGYYKYDSGTKTLTIYTKSFSPFTVEYKYAGGLGTSGSPYLISTVDQLSAAVNSSILNKKQYVKVTKDLKFESTENSQGINCELDSNMKAYLGVVRNMVIDFDYHNVVADNGFGCNTVVFQRIDYSTIKNLNLTLIDRTTDLTGISLTQVVDYITTFDNVNISGNVSVGSNYGAYLYYAGAYIYKYSNGSYITNTITFNNCTADINATGRSDQYAGVYVGFTCYNDNKLVKNSLIFNNCENKGNFVNGRASMFLGNIPSSSCDVTIKITNCKNSGIIQATEVSGWKKYSSSNTTNFYNQIVSSNIGNCKSITVNGTVYTTAEAYSQIEIATEGVGAFIHGPTDTSLTLTKNSDGSFTVTKGSTSDISYYVVSVGLYTTLTAGGTNRQYVTETIQSGEWTNDKATTTYLKYLNFVDETWVSNKGLTVSTDSDNGYKYVTYNDVTYYVIDSKNDAEGNATQTLNGNVRAPQMVTVSAYDEQGQLLASVSLSN
jgi:predicted ribosomally synthesized peptide with SipW-like signal peptide